VAEIFPRRSAHEATIGERGAESHPPQQVSSSEVDGSDWREADVRAIHRHASARRVGGRRPGAVGLRDHQRRPRPGGPCDPDLGGVLTAPGGGVTGLQPAADRRTVQTRDAASGRTTDHVQVPRRTVHAGTAGVPGRL